MKIELVIGSVWQVVGSDNIDSLVGTNPIGVVFSEYALSSPAAWDLMRPILAENDGWALFIGTPRGENHFADLYRMGQAALDWFAELLTVDDTRAIGSDAIARERDAGMPEALIRQEFFCSFQSGVASACFGTYLEPRRPRAASAACRGSRSCPSSRPGTSAWMTRPRSGSCRCTVASCA
jgi:hypothetical protein